MFISLVMYRGSAMFMLYTSNLHQLTRQTRFYTHCWNSLKDLDHDYLSSKSQLSSRQNLLNRASFASLVPTNIGTTIDNIISLYFTPLSRASRIRHRGLVKIMTAAAILLHPWQCTTSLSVRATQ